MKTGRPKLPEQSRKLQITGLRLRQDERKKVEMAAGQRNQKLSDWMRETLLSTAERQLKNL
jgi:uncharacterized protein (DUF1778 family)